MNAAVESIKQDVRYGLRLMRSSTGFALVAILSLSLGIGATIAIFSVMYALILKPLPVLEPDRLVQVTRSDEAPYHAYAVWKELSGKDGVFSAVAAYYPWDSHFNVTTTGEYQNVAGLYVSGTFFQTLGIRSILGRTLIETDDQPSALPVCVIGYGLWRELYSQSPSVLGRMVVLNGHAFQVVGVAPPSFFGLEIGKRPQVFVPLAMQKAFQDHQRWWNGIAKPTLDQSNALVIIGRLKDGASMSQADSWLRVVGIEIYKALPPVKYSRGTLIARPMPSGTSRSYFGHTVLLMATMAGVALLIACANLTNLLLARATRRQTEMAIRLALGATRSRLVRQLLTESVALSMAGTAGGLIFAHWARTALLPTISFYDDPTILDLSWDAKLVLVVVGIMILSALLFGLAPAIRASRSSLFSAMQNSFTIASGRSRLSNAALILAQVALSVALFHGAGLLVRTQHALLAKDPGYEAQGVLVAQVGLRSENGSTQREAFEASELLNAFRSVPGVIAASWTANPYNSIPPELNVPQVTGSERPVRGYRVFVSPDFFKTRRTPILAGRDFDVTDNETSVPIAVLSEQAAQLWFHGVNPIGLSFHENDGGSSGQEYPVRIVGIAKNIDFQAATFGPLPVFYRLASQCSACAPMGRYEIRFAGSMSDSPIRLKNAATTLDPSLTVEFRSLTDEIKSGIQKNTAAARMGTLFGLFIGLLMMIGIYGVTSYAASQRTREIGIRMTLGAQRDDTVRMMLSETAIPVLLGILLGIPAALAGTRLLRSLLWGVAPNDLHTFISAACLILLVAFGAALLPALRATRVDPMISLRYE